MTERREYEMTKEQLAELLEASRPVPYMVMGGHSPSSPQENANRAWRSLADQMGFDWKTVQRGKDDRHFTAVSVLEDVDRPLLPNPSEPVPWRVSEADGLCVVEDRPGGPCPVVANFGPTVVGIEARKARSVAEWMVRTHNETLDA